MKKQKFNDVVNKQIFYPPAIILVLAVAVGAIFPTQFGNASDIALSWITKELGWVFTLGAIILLVFCIWAGFSKYGKIMLGGPDAKPSMSKFQWFAVSFTSSLAIGVSYWCVAEPMTYFMNPPAFLGIQGQTAEAAMVGGIGTSLGLGTMQIAGGLNYVFGMDTGIGTLTIIIIVMTIIYTIVATTGIHKGIKHVGTFNMYLYFFLLVFVFVFGPTRGILENTITATGDYFANIIPLVTNLDPIHQTGWQANWTIFYWAWWLAFAPLTGLFMVKLANGRTIREFVTINLIAPASFILIWFGTFGTAGIFSDMFNGTDIGAKIMEHGSSIAMFELLEHFPLTAFMSLVVILLVALSFNTQAEAVAYTLSAMTTVGFDDSGDEKDPPKMVTVFWGVLMGLITIVLLYTGGEKALQALQTSVVVCGFPIIFLQILMAYSHFKCMTNCKQYDLVGTFDDDRYKDIVADQTFEEEFQKNKR